MSSCYIVFDKLAFAILTDDIRSFFLPRCADAFKKYLFILDFLAGNGWESILQTDDQITVRVCEVSLDHALVDQIRHDTFQLIDVHVNTEISQHGRSHLQRDFVGFALQQKSANEK